MRILWASNAPHTKTGYGTQTAQVVRRLKAAGHDVAVAANHGVQDVTFNWEGIPVFPPGTDPYGQDVLPLHAAEWRADLVLTLFDVWVYTEPAVAALPIASWTPVDHDPVPQHVLRWAAGHRSIAMSRFGQRAFEAAGIKADYVPHAIEPVWQPTPSDMRERMSVPADAFLVMVNAANKGIPPRKGWAEMLIAFKAFSDRHSDAILYLHTDTSGNHGGLPLEVVLSSIGVPQEKVRVAPQAAYRAGVFNQEDVARLYTASDVLLSTSYGEGFGLAVIEAQACGTPVIVSDATAQPELCGAGWTVPTQPFYDWTQGSCYGVPLISGIVEALESAYNARGTLRDKAVEFAAGYAADKVFAEHWKPLLADLDRWLHPATTRQQRRAAARRKR